MFPDSMYSVAADMILIIHTLFVLFVVLGLVLIYLGRILSWAWVRYFWFRLLHLVAITFVVLQSWLGAICPLTIWEMQLRQHTGDEAYHGAFIEHWFQALLYYDLPAWVFVVAYTAFGALVLASWFIVPPRRGG